MTVNFLFVQIFVNLKIKIPADNGAHPLAVGIRLQNQAMHQPLCIQNLHRL